MSLRCSVVLGASPSSPLRSSFSRPGPTFPKPSSVPVPELHTIMATFKPFEESDWNVEFVDPFQIDEGSCIRLVRAEGVSIIVESIRVLGWDPNSLVIVYRDPAPPADSSAAPRFLCLDGMHRERAVCELSQELMAADSKVRWPKSWPVADGHIRMQCAVLHAVPSQADIVRHALRCNVQTGAIVSMTYLNFLSCIAARQNVVDTSGDAAGGSSKAATVKSATVKLMTGTMQGIFSEQTISKDYSTLQFLKENYQFPALNELGSKHGHRWFSRRSVENLRRLLALPFVIRTFSLWPSRYDESKNQYF
jgi:hypothetical protein